MESGTSAVMGLLDRLAAAPSKLPRPSAGSIFASQLAFDFADPDGDVEMLAVTTTAPDGSRATLELGAATLGILGEAGSSTHQVVFTATSLLGSHEYRLRLIDAQGNSSPEATVSILLTQGGTPRLEITSMDPTSGTAGDQVTLRGNGLGAEAGMTKVALSGVEAAVFAEGQGWIRCQVPAGAVTGPVQISNPRGTVISISQYVVNPHVTILASADDVLVPLETKSPFAPHHFFVSGVRGSLQDAVATSEIIELDLSSQFVRTVLRVRTVDRAAGLPFLGHLGDIDFLSDGRLGDASRRIQSGLDDCD